ncbi:MAG: sulfur carrier protein ThiS [Candidatus Solibacter usitatus]|nr:sulfur carrier protein ThiS [Candidatus Solibacter usitatus]
MNIVLNGDPHTAREGCTLLGLLESLSIDPSRVAIELDGSIVKKEAWPATILQSGSRVEVVMFVGGG